MEKIADFSIYRPLRRGILEETAVFSNMLCKECSPLQLRKGGARLVRSESFTGETFTVAWQGAHGKLVYMKIATWNVNSIRARADRIEDWLDKTEVDVLALQETKTKDETFPFELFEFLGYEVAHYGLNQWNGVAIASRVGLDSVERAFPNQPAFGKPGDPAEVEARAIGATCNGVRIWSLYVPNGRGLTDPHMAYKMEWMRQLRTNVNGWLRADPAAQFALVGDWNVAPEDADVWDIDFFRENDLTHVSAPEREAFYALLNDEGLIDPVRPYTQGEYTYWDYQAGRFSKNEGMRIDFQLCSPALAARVENAWIDREEREGDGASDHTPVVIELAD